MKNSPRQRFYLSVLVAAIACIGCDTVVPPPTDETAPYLIWKVKDLNGDPNDETVFPLVNGTFTAKVGQSLRITCKSADPEGLKGVSIHETDTPLCKPAIQGRENTGTTSFTTPSLPQDVIFAKSPSGTVPTSWTIIQYLTIEPDCPDGYVFQSEMISFTATVENWNGLVTHGGLTIRAYK
jgi:hypothetical protein